MAIKVDTITLPAFLVCALINGDESGLDDNDSVVLENVLANHIPEGWCVVSTVEDSERFTWSYRLYGGNASGGDVLDYVIHSVE
jgi:hypothetical protein